MQRVENRLVGAGDDEVAGFAVLLLGADDIFNANKGQLLNLYANWQREEARLVSLTPAELQDESKIFASIDRVTQARAEVEKENAHILLQIRHGQVASRSCIFAQRHQHRAAVLHVLVERFSEAGRHRPGIGENDERVFGQIQTADLIGNDGLEVKCGLA